MSRSKHEPKTIRFKAGDKVRVKYGVIDPDFPDIPLGGWTGAITEIEAAAGQVTYEIRWDKKTLEGIHPVYRNRCERDGLEVETMWLGDEDLEPEDGSRVPIEQPTKIVTKPLSEKDQDDRVRMALALTHDDPLPQVGRKTLLVYYRYLAVNLKFPFRAKSVRQSVAHGPPAARPQGVRTGRGGRAALRGWEPGDQIRDPAGRARRRGGEPQSRPGLWLLVLELELT